MGCGAGLFGTPTGLGSPICIPVLSPADEERPVTHRRLPLPALPVWRCGMGWSCSPRKGDLRKQGGVGKVLQIGVLVPLPATRPLVAILKFFRRGCLPAPLFNAGLELDGPSNSHVPLKQL